MALHNAAARERCARCVFNALKGAAKALGGLGAVR
jgi:hypothetical protein